LIQRVFFLAIPVILITAISFAQDKYPTKPVNLVVGYAAGGLNDVQVRSMAPQLSKELGQNVIVINKPGAGTTLAINFIANSKPDGYNLMNGGFYGIVAAPFMYEVSWHPEDFTYLMCHSNYNFGIVVRTDAPWKTFQEWVDHVRKNPGFKYGTYGNLTPMHIMMEWIGRELGLKLVHIPYTGGAPGLTALLGGHIEIYGSAGTHVPMVKGGKVRTLLHIKGKIADPPGVKVQQLSEFFKNPPVEIIDLPVGIFGPKGLPGPIVQRLTEALKKSVLENPDFLKANDTLNMEVAYLAPDEAVKLVKSSYGTYGKLLKDLNMIKQGDRKKVE
jgi:tripartite-type tricarboxylate transporter receptor subunit TctC